MYSSAANISPRPAKQINCRTLPRLDEIINLIKVIEEVSLLFQDIKGTVS